MTTGEHDGYYGDFPALADLAAATVRPFVYDGRFSAFRRRRHGAPADGIAHRRFVVCSQNHDQVCNRAQGDRPAAELRPLAALWTILSPYTPMLFMGEEYGETRPFVFFTDHIDPFIADATREGRRNEFAAFEGFSAEEVPDPQDPESFRRSVLDPAAGDPGLRELYRSLLALRRELPDGAVVEAMDEEAGWIAVRRGEVTVAGNFGDDEVEVPVTADEVLVATGADVALDDGTLRLPRHGGAALR
jgi:maltooligosyltrehalose trehalohydrolase